jgi:AraC family transcriptional regulator of arabinose operon
MRDVLNAADELEAGRLYREIREQGTPDYLLMFTLSGEGRIRDRSGSELLVGQGMAVLHEPDTFHDYGTAPSSAGWHFLWVHFQPRAHWLPWLSWAQPRPGLRTVRTGEPDLGKRITRSMRRMVQAFRLTDEVSEGLAAVALEEAILWLHSVDASSSGQWDPRVRKAIDHLTLHADEPFRLSRLANRCGLSVSRLAHLFREQTGTTPQRMHEQIRLRQAAQYLRLSQFSIAEVADRVGFDNPFYFSNRFRQKYGMSPTAYRRSGDQDLVPAT